MLGFFILRTMEYQVYIMYSKTLDRYYVGYTLNLESRINKHLSKHIGYTSRAKDWRIVNTEQYGSKSEAYGREGEIKKWKSRKKIEGLMNKD